MCVGIPAKVLSLKGDVALVDSNGAKKQISSELISDLIPGDYVMVHAGAAIARITADDDDETDALLDGLEDEEPVAANRPREEQR